MSDDAINDIINRIPYGSYLCRCGKAGMIGVQHDCASFWTCDLCGLAHYTGDGELAYSVHCCPDWKTETFLKREGDVTTILKREGK